MLQLGLVAVHGDGAGHCDRKDVIVDSSFASVRTQELSVNQSVPAFTVSGPEKVTIGTGKVHSGRSSVTSRRAA